MYRKQDVSSLYKVYKNNKKKAFSDIFIDIIGCFIEIGMNGNH